MLDPSQSGCSYRLQVEAATMLAVSDLGVDHPEVSKQLKALQNKLIQAGIKHPAKSTAQRIGVGE